MNILVFDAEIKKAIPNKDGSVIDGIEYCEGWHDHANMGISVMGAYESITGRARVFMDDNKEEFFRAIEKADLVVGFNSKAFDANLVKAAWDYEIPEDKHYDILVEVWKAKGLSGTFQYPSHIGYGLDALCEKNLGIRKTGHGALAPVDWQQGKIGKVIDYCLNDIQMTRLIMSRIINTGELRCPKTNEPIKIRQP